MGAPPYGRLAGEPPVPVYWAVEQDIRAKIRAGHWPRGSVLPSRKKLAVQYGVSLNTIQQAVTSLVKDGTLRTEDRHGTFVARAEALADVPARVAANGGSAVATFAPDARAATQAATLGIISSTPLPDHAGDMMPNPWAVAVVAAMEKAFSVCGGTTRYFNVVYPALRSYPSPHAAIEAAVASGIDALAIVSVPGILEWVEEMNRALEEVRMPCLLVWGQHMQSPAPHVFDDQWAAGMAAADHLLRRGYESVVFLEVAEDTWLLERSSGARAAAVRLGLPEEVCRSHKCGTGQWGELRRRPDVEQYAALLAALKEVLGRAPATAPGHTGIIAPSDHEAVLVPRALGELGYRVGVDVGLVGFDDSSEARTLGISSIPPPLEAMGRTAGTMLARALGGEPLAFETRLASEVVARRSTSRVAG